MVGLPENRWNGKKPTSSCHAAQLWLTSQLNSFSSSGKQDKKQTASNNTLDQSRKLKSGVHHTAWATFETEIRQFSKSDDIFWNLLLTGTICGNSEELLKDIINKYKIAYFSINRIYKLYENMKTYSVFFPQWFYTDKLLSYNFGEEEDFSK